MDKDTGLACYQTSEEPGRGSLKAARARIYMSGSTSAVKRFQFEHYRPRK